MQFIAPYSTLPTKSERTKKPRNTPDNLPQHPEHPREGPDITSTSDTTQNTATSSTEQVPNEQNSYDKNGWKLHSAIKDILKNNCFQNKNSDNQNSTNTTATTTGNAQMHYNAQRDFMDIKGLESSVDYTELLYKVLIIGDCFVGKTSLVQSYANGKPPGNYKMTLGVDFALKVVKWSENISVKLQLWDIAGQERFTCMTRVYYKDAHACIIMFDLTQRQTFLNAMKWKGDLDSKCTLPDGSPIPCILLANKCDLKHREVEQSEIEAFCKEQEFIGWTEVSVKEGLMIEEAMKFLLEEMMQRYSENTLSHSSSTQLNGHHSPYTSSTVRLSQQPKQDKCKC